MLQLRGWLVSTGYRAVFMSAVPSRILLERARTIKLLAVCTRSVWKSAVERVRNMIRSLRDLRFFSFQAPTRMVLVFNSVLNAPLAPFNLAAVQPVVTHAKQDNMWINLASNTASTVQPEQQQTRLGATVRVRSACPASTLPSLA
jgi:hypothetical protein